MSTAAYVLFYADSCKFCREFMSKMNQNQLGDNFEMVDVMTTPPPAGVTSVPTVYEKVTCKLRKGDDVFSLLDDMGKDVISNYEFGHGMHYSDLEFTSSSNTESFSWIE